MNVSGSRFHYAADTVKLELRFDARSDGQRLIMTKFRQLHVLHLRLASLRRIQLVTCSQGQSFITDHDTQVELLAEHYVDQGPPHVGVWRPDSIETYDNYAQTNIASGAFGFNGSWTNRQRRYPTANTAVFRLPISCWATA